MTIHNSHETLDLVKSALEDMKSQDLLELNVKDITIVTDYMVIVSGTSTQHLRSIVNHVHTQAKQKGVEVLGSEGVESAEWILLDLGDVIVHAMLPEIRERYELEKLWSVEAFSEAACA
ncbi:MAG: ribosome silencing factor [Gammaproteobacteria bacterium]|nr:ribosome silencing factor [Gammaproteobacteria bacterium]